MALPTAQLGQLPTMSMPYSIPTYEVTRTRDKVLQALLVNLAAGIGQQAVSNVMSRDYADQPAGVLSKLVSGPKVDRTAFEKNTARAHETQLTREQLASRESIATKEDQLARYLQTRREGEGAAERTMRQKIAGDELAQAYARMVNDAQLRRELSASENEARLAAIDREYGFRGRQAATEAQARERLLQEEYRLRGQLPSEQRYTPQYMQQLMHSATGDSPAGGPTINPNISQFATPLNPKQQALQDFLASPEGQARYPTESVNWSQTPVLRTSNQEQPVDLATLLGSMMSPVVLRPR